MDSVGGVSSNELEAVREKTEGLGRSNSAPVLP